MLLELSGIDEEGQPEKVEVRIEGKQFMDWVRKQEEEEEEEEEEERRSK